MRRLEGSRRRGEEAVSFYKEHAASPRIYRGPIPAIEGKRLERVERRAHRDEGASEVIGSILMVALTVVTAASLVGVISFADLGPRDQVRAEFTLQAHAGEDGAWGTGDEYVTIRHKGGEAVPLADFAIIADIQGQATRYSGALLVHGDQTVFGEEPTPNAFTIGERWQTPLSGTNALTVNRGDIVSIEIVAGPGDPRVIWSGSVKAPPPDAPTEAAEPSADHTTITADPTKVHLDEEDESTITVTVRDDNGNPVNEGGDTACLATDHGTLTSATGQGDCGAAHVQATDHGDGTYTATLTANTPGEATITGTLNEDGTIDDEAFVRFVSPDPETTTLSAEPTWLKIEEESTITVQVNDQFGEAWTGPTVPVCLATDHGTLNSDTPNEDCDEEETQADEDEGQDGVYTATLTAETEGTATVTGTLDGDPITDEGTPEEVTVTFVPEDDADPTTTTIEATPTSLHIDESSTITVTVNDGNGDPVGEGGDEVCLETDHGTLSSTTGQGTCPTGETQATDVGDGTYTATLTAPTPGEATITGTLNTDTIQDTATVTFHVLTYVNDYTTNRGSVSDFENMQADDGLLATLTEGGETQGGTPTTSTFSANVIRANPVSPNQVTWTNPTNAFTNDANFANAQVTGGSNEISQIRYGLQDPTTESGDITSVILKADVRISSGQTGDAVFRLQACFQGGSCSQESNQLIGQNPGQRHTIEYDITNLRPEGGSWTWTDIENLEVIVTALKNTNPNRSFDLFWARADVGHEGSVTTYALDIENTFTNVPSAAQHDLELRYQATGDTFTLQVWNPSTSQWSTKSPTLSATSLTTWSTTLSEAEYANGEPTLRFVDNTPNGETQGTLDIDYLRVRST